MKEHHTAAMQTPDATRGSESLIRGMGAPNDEMLDDVVSGAEGVTTPDETTQGTSGESPEDEHPEGGEPSSGDDLPEAGAKGGPAGDDATPKSGQTREAAGQSIDPQAERLFGVEEFQRLAQARERLERLQAESAFLESFLDWANEHPEGGVCTIHGRTIGEFNSEQMARAVEQAKRRLNGVEMDRRLAAERLDSSAAAAMSRVTQTARVIAPGLFVQGHAQQRAAQAIVASIPETTRRAIENDPAANLVLALAVRGLEALKASSARTSRPSPTRSVSPAGSSGEDMAVEPTKVSKQQMVKRLIEGRGSVSELAALLR